ncbi:MAG: class I SAM-dependent methyltransferase [Verrucomicrobiota bacterium]|nr:class I SAM-dependent methyltransferase [Verrucomicrobiota bacterium]
MSHLAHESLGKTFEEAFEKTRAKIEQRGNLPYVTIARQLELLEQLAQFEFGRSLILHQGRITGYWAYYTIRHSFIPHPKATPLERFILERSPTGKATTQRFRIMQTLLQKRLKEGILLASIPCSSITTLLTLNFSKIKRFELMGVDAELESTRYVQELASQRGLESHIHCYEKDAWKTSLREVCDGIVSHGLNFYEPDDDKVLALYKQFYHTLKPGGFLLLSYLTPPPGVYHRSEWLMDKISLEDALLQRILFIDILNACWSAFRTTEQTRQQLAEAGFSHIETFPDEARILPVALASKS